MVAEVFSYTAYGLNIRSALPIPALDDAPAAREPDIDIRLADLSELRAAMSRAGERQRLAAHEVCLLSDDLGTFVIRDGCEILLDPAPTLDAQLVHIILLGLPMAALLQQRGFLLLHGSSVSIDGGAVAFVGASGIGKSTIAAALHARGHELVVDDVIAIRFDRGEPEVQPGFPQFKLWPDSLAALGEDAARLPQLDPELEKRARRITHGFCTPEPLRLKRIYFLAWGDSARVERLEPREIFLKLSGHSYGVRWLHELSGPAFFRERAELARSVPVRNLVRPRDLTALDRVTGLVEQDSRNGA